MRRWPRTDSRSRMNCFPHIVNKEVVFGGGAKGTRESGLTRIEIVRGREDCSSSFRTQMVRCGMEECSL
jgi:hypothetical protein